jgi:hypothetical protein
MKCGSCQCLVGILRYIARIGATLKVTLELVLFAGVLAAIWQVRRWQLRSLRTQEALLKSFAEGVNGWRRQPNIPPDARQAIETIVDMPISRLVILKFTLSFIRRQLPPPRLNENPFWLARQQLSLEQREGFDWLLLTFFLAMTYSDWVAGPFLRRVRFGGLSRETQAEVALETVFSRNMGRAIHA